MSKLKLKIKPENFSLFVSKIENIAAIDDTVRVKIDSENILMYSMLGGGNVMLAFKNFLLNTSDFFDIGDFDYTIDMIIPNAKKFVKNLAFIREMDKIGFDITYKEDEDDELLYAVRTFQLSSGKFKVNWLGGELYSVRDIGKAALAQRLNPKDKKWSFNIGNQDFLDVKKLSSINGERIICMDVTKGKVIFSEKSSWELEVDEIESDRNAALILNKRFLSCINDKLENIEFCIFENFMLIKDENSNLMLSFEQDFSDQD
jgi:hypothetical protein